MPDRCVFFTRRLRPCSRRARKQCLCRQHLTIFKSDYCDEDHFPFHVRNLFYMLDDTHMRREKRMKIVVRIYLLLARLREPFFGNRQFMQTAVNKARELAASDDFQQPLQILRSNSYNRRCVHVARAECEACEACGEVRRALAARLTRDPARLVLLLAGAFL